MAVPCTSIPSQRHKKQKPPIKQQRAEEEEDRNKGPNKMPTPCRWLRVGSGGLGNGAEGGWGVAVAGPRRGKRAEGDVRFDFVLEVVVGCRYGSG
ncbi:hypothetical protein ACE6H2_002133 [Prunus campanulata]